MSVNDYEARQAARVERFRELADKNEERAEQLSNQARRMADAIPMGQPILIGHHSESRDRNYRNRIGRTMDRACEAHDKAEYYRRRADAAENNNAIRYDDPEALSKLRAKLDRLEKVHAAMVDANRVIRSKKKTYDEKIAAIEALGISRANAEKLLSTPDCFGNVGFAPFQVSNSNANIRRVREQIKGLEAMSKDRTKRYRAGDVDIIDDVEEKRIKVFFPGIPDQSIRTGLKQAGFRWSPSNQAWQSYRGSQYLMRLKSILGRDLIEAEPIIEVD